MTLRRTLLALGLMSVATAASADDLYHPGNWSAMTSDRLAEKVGDTLTVQISENASATNSADNASQRATSLGGQLTLSRSTRQAQGSLNSGFSGTGQSGRSGTMVAQISVTVDRVYPNGDLHVVGQQSLRVNGEDTHIKVQGRVRLVDISATNTVQSTRIADAVIDYNGNGFTSRSAKPGLITRLLNVVGLP